MKERMPQARKKRIRIDGDWLQALLIWALGSLLAIAFIGDLPYPGLVIALLAGVALGLATVLTADRERAGRETGEAGKGSGENKAESG